MNTHTLQGRTLWEVLMQDGRRAVKEGEPQQAIACFKAAAEEAGKLDLNDPRRASSLRRLGIAYAAIGHHTDAEQAFAETLRVIEANGRAETRDLTELYEGYGGLLRRLARIPDAEAAEARIRVLFANHDRLDPEA